MAQAKILVNAVIGSDDDLPINTLVQLANQDIGGESSYAWAILDQPPGTVDTLSSSSIANPTFTPRKEGSYLLKLTVNLGLADEQSNTVIVGIRQMKTLERIPASGESTEVDTADGWATAMNSLLRRVDSLLSDPGIIVGANNSGGSLSRGDVLRVNGTVTIKAGLYGQEYVPGFTTAPATSGGNVDELLVILEGAVDGSTGVASGGLLKARYIGRFASYPISSGSAGDSIYVTDLAGVSTTPGTFSRQCGSIMGGSGGSRDLWFDGIGSYTITPVDRAYVVNGNPGTLPNAVRVDSSAAFAGAGFYFLNASGNTTNTPLTIRGGSGQTADILTVGAYGSVNYLRVDATGAVHFGNGTTINMAASGNTFQLRYGINNFLYGTTDAATQSILRMYVGATSSFIIRGYPTAVELECPSANAIILQAGGAQGIRVTSTVVQLGSGTWTISGGILASSGGPRAIQGVLDPVTAQDAATKNYCDNATPAVANVVINGGFALAQRYGKNTISPAAAYFGTRRLVSDRWKFQAFGTAGSHYFVDSGGLGFHQAPGEVYFYRASGNAETTVPLELSQEIDRDLLLGLRDKKISIQFSGYHGGAAAGTWTVYVITGTNAAQTFTGTAVGTDPSYATGNTQVLKQTFVLTASQANFVFASSVIVPTGAKAMAVIFRFAPTGTSPGPTEYTLIQDVMLYVTPAGNNTTAKYQPFVPCGGSYATDIRECLRYFQKSFPLTGGPVFSSTGADFTPYASGEFAAWFPQPGATGYVGVAFGSGTSFANIRFPVAMRSNPTVTLRNSTGAAGLSNWQLSGAATAVAANTVGESSFYVAPSGVTWTLTTQNRNAITGQWYADAEI